MSATSRQLQQFLAQLEPSIARAFRKAVAEIQDRAQIAALEEAIREGNFEAALRASGVRQAQWQSLVEAVRSAYFEGGVFAAAADVPLRYGFQFDISGPRPSQLLSTPRSSSSN